MFFFLSKTAYFVLMPLGWIIICFALSFILRPTVWKKRLRWTTLLLIIVFTNPFLANEFMRLWELPAREFSELKGNYELAIVLTGVSDNKRLPADRVYFNKGADRVTHTIQLYKMGRIDSILISGGSGSFSPPPVMEADNLKMAMVLLGVPEDVISVENTSRNTYQSAANVSEILDNNSQSIILITSSFHMRRARACFTKQDLDVEVFPVDFYSSKRSFSPDAWIPSPYALSKWTRIFREIVGIAAYKIMGYA